jgi:hypothetical protein
MTRFVEAFPGQGTSVVYVDENGYHVLYSERDRTWRNNNPGNLRPGTVSRRNGQIGVAGRFAVFPDYEAGHAAHVDLLINVYGIRDLAGLIKTYAPSSENDSKKYLRYLRKHTAVQDNRKIQDFTKPEFEKLWRAMEKYEGQKTGKIQVLPLKKKITGVQKDKRGRILEYFVKEIGWLTKKRAIQLAERGEIDVVVVRRGGAKYLRSRPDTSQENNLSNIAKA